MMRCKCRTELYLIICIEKIMHGTAALEVSGLNCVGRPG
jgi:hypothetical protein